MEDEKNLGTIRSQKAKKNVTLSLLYKGGSIIASLLLVSITIKFLDAENYGIWLTLSSIIGWLAFFDVGLGNGLRNKLSVALALNDKTLARQYVSTAYLFLGGIMLGLFLLFIVLNPFLNWQSILNTTHIEEHILQKCACIVFLSFSIRFVLDLISVVVNADQRTALAGLLIFLSNIIVLVLVFLLTKLSKPYLLNFVLVATLGPIIILVLANYFLFSRPNYYSFLAPMPAFFNKSLLKDLFSLGIQFFLIQIVVIILFASHNVIITQIFGPSAVTPYNVAFRYFSTVTMVFTILLAPYWSAFTESYLREDYRWITNAMNKLIKTWLLSVIGVAVMLVVAPFIYKLWVGPDVRVPTNVSIGMACFVVISNWNSIFATFINGVSKIRLQLYSSILTGLINIPLSIFLAKYTNFGISGVIFGTSVCLLVGAIWAPIQYKKLITKTAKGIWNK